MIEIMMIEISTLCFNEEIYKSSKILNISRNSISNCLTGRCKSSGGYHWKYNENEVKI